MRLTYKDLKNNSYSTLIKKGATDSQILKKLSNYYLKENRQLTINERQGLTISKAMQELKKGRVRQGVYIHRTAISTLKNDLKNLKTLSKTFGKNSFADKLLKEFSRGEINVYQINKSMYSYTNNLAEYEEKYGSSGFDVSIIDVESQYSYDLQTGN